MYRAAVPALSGALSLYVTCVALAQPYDTGHVTVRASREVNSRQLGRTTSGIPIDTVELSHRISYQDLNLATRAGVAELERRITASAEEACRQIDMLYPGDDVPETSSHDCVSAAVKGAMAQVQSAIADSERSPRVRSEASGGEP